MVTDRTSNDLYIDLEFPAYINSQIHLDIEPGFRGYRKS